MQASRVKGRAVAMDRQLPDAISLQSKFPCDKTLKSMAAEGDTIGIFKNGDDVRQPALVLS